MDDELDVSDSAVIMAGVDGDELDESDSTAQSTTTPNGGGSSGSNSRRISESGGSAPEVHLLYNCERYQHAALYPSIKTRKVVQWRMKELRMKTGSVALTLCLNIGVDPPDVIKTTPCARLEAWIDPFSQAPPKALEAIGKSLQLQYERWQPRARYKHCLDPTADDVKKWCNSLRRAAKDERILYHYNGHGVPRPTQNGEIWVFNKNFTQYIPLSLYELQIWLGTPSMYVFDCSASGLIVQWFNKFADQREQEYEKSKKKNMSSSGMSSPTSSSNNNNNLKDYILLGACAANEVLPTNPELPADVFTACLTTPIKIALRWFCTQTIVPGINTDLLDKIPGRLADRRTPLGELNWIFTAITDTIAWNVLPHELFQKLFRQDLLVASLFRNFLLAQRIMRSCKCTPVSHPKLPTTYNHPMWQAWDLATDHILVQLPQLVSDAGYEYQHTSFFTEQLTAFEVWLQFGTEDKNPPEQLPIVLQVLLSQQHRLRALELLGRFLDLGPWAVNQALSVGIFPYVLKLLQSPAVELRRILVFIWAKILALDQSCQLDLVKDNGQHYFVNVLSNTKVSSELRQQAAFVLSVICNNCRPGQSACLNARLLQICLGNLNNNDAMLRRWVVLALAKLWENHEEGKKIAIKENAHEKLCGLLTDPVPEVRAAAVYALGTFIGRSGTNSVSRENRTLAELNLGLTFAVVTADSSPLVRKELVIATAALINNYEDKFKIIEKNSIKLELKQRGKKNGVSSSDTDAGSTTDSSSTIEQQDQEENGIYEFLWNLVFKLASDPFHLVSQLATIIIKKIRDQVLEEMKLPSSLPPPPSPQQQQQQQQVQQLQQTQQQLGGGITGGGGNDTDSKTKSFPLNLFSKPPVSPNLNRKPSSTPPQNSERQVDEIRSCLYEWSCQHFSQPLMTLEPVDETSPTFIERQTRLQRNSEIIEKSASLKTNGVAHTLENEIAILENDQMVSQLCFHAFENLVFVADEHEVVSVWNWEISQLTTRFSNGNPTGTRITSLDLLNEAGDSTLVAVGADDGVVRIWSGTSKLEPQLVTAWRALGESTAGAGLVLEWQQKNDLVIASGNIDLLKVWDVNRELCIQDIPTSSTSGVTCLTSDKYEGGKLVVVGCWDGSIRLFDRRVNTRFSHVATLVEHRGYTIDVSMPSSLDQQIISGSASGDLKFWDTRNTNSSIRTIPARKGESVMTALAVHDIAPVIAMGQEQRIKVMNFQGDQLSIIRYHDGFLGQRIGPVSSLCFHPYKVMLAAGATDSIVSVYAGEPKLKA